VREHKEYPWPENVPHLDWHTLCEPKGEDAAKIAAAFDKYFAPFAQPPGEKKEDGSYIPKEGQPCLNCGEMLTGLMAHLIGSGGFEWGIAHGEGRCSNCHWPARLYHFITDDAGEKIVTIRNILLQYHPDVVTRRVPETAGVNP
jgi:hypothetical protein